MVDLNTLGEMAKKESLTDTQKARIAATKAEMEANAGVLDPRTPKEIEDALVKQLEEEQLERLSKLPPEELQAMYFQSQWPQFRYLAEGLSGAEARRVLLSLVGWPIEIQNPYLSTSRGKNTFLLAQQLLQSKQVMVDAVEIKKFNEANDVDKTSNLGDNALAETPTVESSFSFGEEAEKVINNG